MIRRLAALAAVAVAVVVAMTMGAADRGPRPAPAAAVAPAGVTAPTGVDVVYARMMVVHHAQAVELSRILLAETGVTERIRNIAEFIVQDQQREIDETNAWLAAWDLPAAGPDEHGGDPASHGMLTAAQLGRVEAAPPAEASRLFLRQMIAHHTGAITMSKSVLESGANVYVHGLAVHVVNEQSAENDAMRALLATPPPRG
jgi:uncharacterized protein (DUF305 family)